MGIPEVRTIVLAEKLVQKRTLGNYSDGDERNIANDADNGGLCFPFPAYCRVSLLPPLDYVNQSLKTDTTELHLLWKRGYVIFC
jgi:hypothetical protein